MNKKRINIGDNIRKFREIKNITREKMAAELNLSLSGYSKIERNEIDLTITRVHQIAEAIDVDVSNILNFDVLQVLNISNDNHSAIQTIGSKIGNTGLHPDEYKDKYISLLEKEISRLKKIVGED